MYTEGSCGVVGLALYPLPGDEEVQSSYWGRHIALTFTEWDATSESG